MTTPPPHTLARTTDPATSHQAARKPRRTDAIRAGIAACMAKGEAVTLDQIVERYKIRAIYDRNIPTASDSSIRSRVAEMRRDKLIEEAGRAKSYLGNPATLWRAVTAQPENTENEND